MQTSDELEERRNRWIQTDRRDRAPASGEAVSPQTSNNARWRSRETDLNLVLDNSYCDTFSRSMIRLCR
jgi:hypothetical protein